MSLRINAWVRPNRTHTDKYLLYDIEGENVRLRLFENEEPYTLDGNDYCIADIVLTQAQCLDLFVTKAEQLSVNSIWIKAMYDASHDVVTIVADHKSPPLYAGPTVSMIDIPRTEVSKITMPIEPIKL